MSLYIENFIGVFDEAWALTRQRLSALRCPRLRWCVLPITRWCWTTHFHQIRNGENFKFEEVSLSICSGCKERRPTESDGLSDWEEGERKIEFLTGAETNGGAHHLRSHCTYIVYYTCVTVWDISCFKCYIYAYLRWFIYQDTPHKMSSLKLRK